MPPRRDGREKAGGGGQGRRRYRSQRGHHGTPPPPPGAGEAGRRGKTERAAPSRSSGVALFIAAGLQSTADPSVSSQLPAAALSVSRQPASSVPPVTARYHLPFTIARHPPATASPTSPVTLRRSPDNDRQTDDSGHPSPWRVLTTAN